MLEVLANKPLPMVDLERQSAYSSSSSAFALIEHFAYYCGVDFTPFRPSNSTFDYIEE
jgi:hypothetical protein